MKLPVQLYTIDQVRAMDRYAIDVIGIAGSELMERAGQCAFNLLTQVWPDARYISVFCGAGNNGGDGYVIARLALEHGLQVNLLALATIERLQGDALIAANHYFQAGGTISKIEEKSWKNSDVVVDSLLGTGLGREVGGDYKLAIEAINSSQLPILAVDIPSGLHADSGRVLGVAVVEADQTATFIGLKQGLFTGQAADVCGQVNYYSLEVPQSVLELEQPSALRFIAPSPLLPTRKFSAHKGHFGHVLLIGGESGYSGAICLAAQAAARCGAGLISIATRNAHAALLMLTQPEIMSHGIHSAEQLKPLLEKATVVVIGPGLGQSDWAKQLLNAVLECDLPVVIDADALNLLALDPGCQRNNCVYTPHPGEAARLLNCSSQAVQNDRFSAIRQLHDDYGGIVVLKGAGTLVYDGEKITVNSTGNPGMATGGMGDVLSGVIAGLIAQGQDLDSATRVAVWLHGAAADNVARAGQRGLLASDLLPQIRKLVNQ
ncbi:MAG: NAD(P)H-hydrate dehydratase [Methylococcales bacterium]